MIAFNDRHAMKPTELLRLALNCYLGFSTPF
jgi:hypothetical protein